MLNKTLKPLGKTDIHIWKINISSHHKAWEENISVLSQTERIKTERLINPILQQRAKSIRVQLRLLLSTYLDKHAADITFEQATYGKPYLLNENLNFNISHSQDTALVAISQLDQLGVDIEYWRVLSEREGIVRRHFSSEEQAQWAYVEASQREEFFFNLWTCKEAFIKATGRGLAMGLSSCSFDLNDFNKLRACSDKYGQPSDWSCHSLVVEPKTSASVIVKNKFSSVKMYEFNPEYLP